MRKTFRHNYFGIYIKNDFILTTYLSKSYNYAISFREAGADTLARLESGAGAKPHIILDKTIKKKSLDAKYKALKCAEISIEGNTLLEKLVGLVPVWYTETEVNSMNPLQYETATNDFFMKGLYLNECRKNILWEIYSYKPTKQKRLHSNGYIA